jgi:hypothetical protein
MIDGREATDDGRAWGHVEDGVWRPLPKRPMLLAGLGPPAPTFAVTLPSGEVRWVVHDPDDHPLPLP